MIYRGLNSTCCEGTTKILIDQIQAVLPLVDIHSVDLGKTRESDLLHSIFSDANEQVYRVCEQLKADVRLKDGFNGIGLSQGGLLLRAYIQRCNDPPVKNFITLGSPHAGINDLPDCEESAMRRISENVLTFLHLPTKEIVARWTCRALQRAFKEYAHSALFQSYFLPAQYYIGKTIPEANDEEKPIFIQEINNEKEPRNETFKNNLGSIQTFVMYRFSDDQLVIPVESEWFDLQPNKSLTEQPEIYRKDWLGLRQLNETGRLHLKVINGSHLSWPSDFVQKELFPYLNQTRFK